MSMQAADTGRNGPSSWRRRTASGVLLTSMALGLREALDEPEEEPQVLIDSGGEPFGPAHPVEVHFDPAGPAHTWVVVRPWLLGAGAG